MKSLFTSICSSSGSHTGLTLSLYNHLNLMNIKCVGLHVQKLRKTFEANSSWSFFKTKCVLTQCSFKNTLKWMKSQEGAAARWMKSSRFWKLPHLAFSLRLKTIHHGKVNVGDVLVCCFFVSQLIRVSCSTGKKTSCGRWKACSISYFPRYNSAPVLFCGAEHVCRR